MKAQEYIESELRGLRNDSNQFFSTDKEFLKTEIFRLLMNKKFRKYSVTSEYQEHIRQEIDIHVEKHESIKLIFPFGGYKLWRFPEFPEADWAEVFSLLYYTKWLKPICDIYDPGISLIFYSDDIIISRMNNIKEADLASYRKSFKNILDFFTDYTPANLEFIFERVIDRYKNIEEFEIDLRKKMIQVSGELNDELPELSDKDRISIDLNVRLAHEQLLDPFWREKNYILHQAYRRVKHYYNPEENIFVFALPRQKSLTIGTTKHSIAKFWCGIGVLGESVDGFYQTVLSPRQIEGSNFKEEGINIKGLEGKNFKRIKIKVGTKS